MAQQNRDGWQFGIKVEGFAPVVAATRAVFAAPTAIASIALAWWLAIICANHAIARVRSPAAANAAAALCSGMMVVLMVGHQVERVSVAVAPVAAMIRD